MWNPFKKKPKPIKKTLAQRAKENQLKRKYKQQQEEMSNGKSKS